MFYTSLPSRDMLRSVIPAEGLAQLKRYQYKSGFYSPLDNFLNPFWEWSTAKLPMVRRWLLGSKP